MARIELSHLRKTYGPVIAVKDLSIVIEDGEFVVFVGPSGCGKTTTLRMIAGFETPDVGRIHVGGADVTDVPVHRRNLGMIFQSYALFPHRTVAENVAFGLRMRRLPRAEIADAVARALKQVALAGYEARRPAQLSGGEQQRVALARAIVTGPRVLQLDEPLSALDLKLRKGLQEELRRLQRELAMTFVFVTHEQEEALAMRDRKSTRLKSSH